MRYFQGPRPCCGNWHGAWRMHGPGEAGNDAGGPEGQRRAPVVSVWSKPKGLPSASTCCPTLRVLDSPSVTGRSALCAGRIKNITHNAFRPPHHCPRCILCSMRRPICQRLQGCFPLRWQAVVGMPGTAQFFFPALQGKPATAQSGQEGGKTIACGAEMCSTARSFARSAPTRTAS